MRGFRRRRGPLVLGRLFGRLPFWWIPLVLLVVGLVAVEQSVAGVMRVAAEERARAMAIAAINRAVLTRAAAGLRQQEVVQYRYDTEGRVTLLTVNTPVVNQVAADAAQAVQQAVDQMAATRFAVPLGQALGSKVFGNLGPELPMEFSPLGSALVTVGQRFEGAGINQTRHVVYLQATARLKVVVPLVTGVVEVTTELPLTEAVIVGPVPQSYWQGAGGIITTAPGAVPGSSPGAATPGPATPVPAPPGSGAN
jgi:sporulation protein YunB